MTACSSGWRFRNFDGTMIEQRIRDLKIELPRPSTPGANYRQFVRSGNLVFLTGQLCQWNGERRFIGKLGQQFTVAEGQQAALLGACNLLAHLRDAAGGSLDRVRQVVRVADYINATPDFTGQCHASDPRDTLKSFTNYHLQVGVGFGISDWG